MIVLLKESLSDEELYKVSKNFSNIDAMHKDFIDDLNDDITNFQEETKYDKYISRLKEILNNGVENGSVPSLFYYEDAAEYYKKYTDEIHYLFSRHDLWDELLEYLKEHVEADDIIKNSIFAQNYITCYAYTILAQDFYDTIK